MRNSPGPGSETGRSTTPSTSGPPNSVTPTALMATINRRRHLLFPLCPQHPGPGPDRVQRGHYTGTTSIRHGLPRQPAHSVSAARARPASRGIRRRPDHWVRGYLVHQNGCPAGPRLIVDGVQVCSRTCATPKSGPAPSWRRTRRRPAKPGIPSRVRADEARRDPAHPSGA
jgi:hypothetical protein